MGLSPLFPPPPRIPALSPLLSSAPSPVSRHRPSPSLLLILPLSCPPAPPPPQLPTHSLRCRPSPVLSRLFLFLLFPLVNFILIFLLCFFSPRPTIALLFINAPTPLGFIYVASVFRSRHSGVAKIRKTASTFRNKACSLGRIRVELCGPHFWLLSSCR